MISNIFGLHLGCKCKSDTDEFTLFGMRPSPFECEDTVYLQGEYNDLYDIKDCKLLLKPLSAMSDEDKREFERAFGYEDKVISFEIYEEKTVLVCFEFTDFDGDPMDRWDDVSLNEILWLCSKGYDVGIVPDEYKEVVE